MNNNTEIFPILDDFVNDYLEMDILGAIIPCPYWSNKIKEGKVIIRGFANGKGTAQEIRNELIRCVRLEKNVTFGNFNLDIVKIAKKNRIGIDCSGLVYRILEELVRLRYKGTSLNNVESLFPEGINRTNAAKLTSSNYVIPIKNCTSIRIGDLIRMMGGKHVMVVVKTTDREVTYIHSSHKSRDQGVHLGKVKIIDGSKQLDRQNWEEETKEGENFRQKYFSIEKGDGVFRLKIFQN